MNLDAFRKRFHGPIITREHPEYESARHVWNGMIDRRPALIARCLGTADVVEAVSFARDNGLTVAVRGGGHSVPGHSTCDGGIVIDLSRMKGIHIDRRTGRCWAQPGLTWGEFDRETQLYGLALTGGQISSTGISGLTLGGGIGWLMRKQGLTCDNMLCAEMVCADGRVVSASETENADLLWGLRGGGGNFGIVTSFHFQLHPVGPEILAGTLVYSVDKAKDVLRFMRELMVRAPEELSTCGVLVSVPSVPAFPAHLHGQKALALTVCYTGPIEEGEKLLAPLRSFAKPELDSIQPGSYCDLQTSLDPTAPHGLNYWERSDYLRGLPDAAIDVVLAHYTKPGAPPGEVILFERGGAVMRVAEDATAFSHRDASYLIWIISHWPHGDPDPERYIKWTRDFSDAMKPFACGVYVNGLADEGDGRVVAAYGQTKFDKLRALKTKYDPTNFFRLNQNIKPLGVHGGS